MKLCDLALFSPETSSGVRTYINNKIEYVRTHPEITSHLVIVPGTDACDAMQGRTRIVTVRGLASFYPGVSLAINLCRIADIVEAENPDLIEVNCQYSLGWAAFLATQRRRIPIVGVYHTDVPACASHIARGAGTLAAKLVERAVEYYEALLYRHFTVTIALNRGVLPRLQRMGVHRTNILPCGVDLGAFNPERADANFRGRLGIAPDQKILLYVGRLSAEKELDVLLEAHRRLPEGRFVLLIAGDGPDAATIQSYADTHSDVTYLGHFDSPTELAEVYASSDIFVIPGRYETFGMSALEALACGLPVVAIGGSGTAAFIGPNLGLLSAPGDTENLASQIIEVSEWTKAQSRDASRQFAVSSYSWSSVFDRYFDIYRSLVVANL